MMLLLLVVASLASTLVPQQAQREETTGDTTAATDRTNGRDEPEDGRVAGDRVSTTVDASARAVEQIDLRLGDQLALTVRSGAADQVEIPALGRLEDVEPDAAARFDLLPQRPGTFEVRMVESGRRIAQIRVRRR